MVETTWDHFGIKSTPKTRLGASVSQEHSPKVFTEKEQGSVRFDTQWHPPRCRRGRPIRWPKTANLLRSAPRYPPILIAVIKDRSIIVAPQTGSTYPHNCQAILLLTSKFQRSVIDEKRRYLG